MLPPIVNSPKWLISPDCHKKKKIKKKEKWGMGRSPPAPPPFAHAYAWASFHFELREGQSVSEVFAGIQGAGPLVGV